MKRKFSFRRLLMAALALSCFHSGIAQKKTVEPLPENEVTKLRRKVEANPNDLEAHKAYLETFASADDARGQYEQWLKKYPKSATIPLALAEKYGVYSPERARYLLKVVEREPANAEAWRKLASDASLRGDKEKQIAYMEKAIAADPGNLEYQQSYIFLLNDDKAVFKQRVEAFVNAHPGNEETISLLHIYGTEIKDKKEKMAAWEQLRSLFPESRNVSFQVAMSRLGDVYIQAGEYEKAIELSSAFKDKTEARLNFFQKEQIAKTLLEIESKMKEGNYAEAKTLAMPMNVKSRNLLNVESRVVLSKAATLAATGDTQAAYDSLIVFQARTPYRDVKETLERFAGKLGKNIEQVKKDLRQEIARNSRPAAAYELDMYTSDKKMNLSDQKGKVVLLSAWYPGCGPCRAEMPHIEAAIKSIDRTKMVYHGVNIYRNQDGFVVPFMEASKYSFTPLGGNDKFIKDYDIRVAPSNFIIDQEGRIAYAGFMINADSEEMLEMMIQSLL